MQNLFTFVLLAVAGNVAASPAVAPKACSTDNCLRAVIGSTFQTRSGLADCNAYLRTMVTPATVTFTQTVSQTTSTIATGTARVKTTSTEIDITTLTLQATATSTATSYVTNYEEQRRNAASIQNQNMPASPASIPAYASPCSGAVRYSSACSCVGATATTITAAAPSTTVTVTYTSTKTFISSTTSTSITTTTQLLTSSTIQTTTAVATTTSVTQITYTACAGDGFRLQAKGGLFDGQYGFLPNQFYESQTTFVSSITQATCFLIDNDSGYLIDYLSSSYYNRYANTTPGKGPSMFAFNPSSQITEASREYLNCGLADDNGLVCIYDTSSILATDASSQVTISSYTSDRDFVFYAVY